jgi:hypothetical protein
LPTWLNRCLVTDPRVTATAATRHGRLSIHTGHRGTAPMPQPPGRKIEEINGQMCGTWATEMKPKSSVAHILVVASSHWLRRLPTQGGVPGVDVLGDGSTSAGADNHVGLPLIELGLGEADGRLEIVVAEGRVENLVADETRQVLTELHRLDVLGARAFWPPAFRVGNRLALTQFLKTNALDAR